MTRSEGHPGLADGRTARRSLLSSQADTEDLAQTWAAVVLKASQILDTQNRDPGA